LLLGHELVVFDVDPKTLGVNSGAVSRAMREDQIDVLFVTHLLGLNALTAEMVDAAERSGVVLLEDCCEAHGTRFGSRKVGTYGFGSTFSFYFGHHMSTIEGGMISTNDPGLADELRIMRAHGLARESARFHLHKKDHPQISPDFLFIEPGLNFRSTEINAFLGLRQLEKLDERIQIRNLNMQAFLDSAPEFLWTDFSTEGISSFALPLISRDRESYKRVSETLARLSIEKRPVVAGNLIYQPFMKEAHVRVYDGVTPIADHIHTHGLYVGNGHHVDQGMVRKMTAALA
jgi:CDP-6-deoxy-D-xylo-4-hexulose-3-dehydrase